MPIFVGYGHQPEPDDINAALDALVDACLKLRRAAEHAHSTRPLNPATPERLLSSERALAEVESMVRHERLHRTREALTGRAA